MKSLKEISNIFVSNLSEGLLDDLEDTLSTGDSLMEDKLIESWAVTKDYKIKKTKQGYKLVGSFVIKDIKESLYNGPLIKEVKGNLSIENTQLTNLQNMFAVDCIISGTFTVENNSKLTSLSGCPLQVNTLVITGNKQLKKLDLAPTALMNAYISKNGFKPDKEKLSKELQVYKHIYCSTEFEYDNLINESLLLEAIKAPQLKPVIDALSQFKKVRAYRDNDHLPAVLSDIFQGVKWDKIDSSQISEFDGNDNECLKLARKILTKTDENFKQLGIIVMFNKEGEVTGAIAEHYYISLNKNSTYYDRWSHTVDSNGDKHLSRSYAKRTSVLLDFVKEADTVMIIEFRPGQITEFWKLRMERGAAQKGAIALNRGPEKKGQALSYIEHDEPLLKNSWYSRNNDTPPDIKSVRYYQSIVEENRKRYKHMIDKIRAQKAAMTTTFTNIKRRVDDVFARYTAILEKVMKEPVKYSNNSLEIESLQDKFSYATQKGQGTSKYAQEMGLMVMLKLYTRTVLDAAKGYGNNDNLKETLKNMEESINRQIDIIDTKLKTLEAL
jgi:hypothetical protein